MEHKSSSRSHRNHHIQLKSRCWKLDGLVHSMRREIPPTCQCRGHYNVPSRFSSSIEGLFSQLLRVKLDDILFMNCPLLKIVILRNCVAGQGGVQDPASCPTQPIPEGPSSFQNPNRVSHNFYLYCFSVQFPLLPNYAFFCSL